MRSTHHVLSRQYRLHNVDRGVKAVRPPPELSHQFAGFSVDLNFHERQSLIAALTSASNADPGKRQHEWHGRQEVSIKERTVGLASRKPPGRSFSTGTEASLKPLVLVLDDEIHIRELVTEALEQEGYDVVPVGTMAEADIARSKHEFDIYVLDVLVPDGNGLLLARELSLQSSAGILLLTGQGDEADRVVGLEIGADDYIVKPFRPRELRARVNAVYRRVSRSEPQRPAASNTKAPTDQQGIAFHGMKLLPQSRTLRSSDGNEIELTTLEFDVLHVLVRNVNRVLSRDRIMNEVRGQDWSAYDRSIDGLISRLRRKVYPEGEGAKRIKTVRNIGYMLSTDDEEDRA